MGRVEALVRRVAGRIFSLAPKAKPLHHPDRGGPLVGKESEAFAKLVRLITTPGTSSPSEKSRHSHSLGRKGRKSAS